MKTKNTYSLLIDSEEKGRSLFESAIYGLAAASMAFAFFAFASQTATSPQASKSSAAATDTIATQPAQPLIASRN